MIPIITPTRTSTGLCPKLSFKFPLVSLFKTSACFPLSYLIPIASYIVTKENTKHIPNNGENSP